MTSRKYTLPLDSAERKDIPIAEGCLFYFPAALAEVARVSKAGNDKHNPGQPLHHARGKSMDHDDCVVRHTLDARESDGEARTEHLAARAWRALAALQEHCESLGAPLAPNARPAGVAAAPANDPLVTARGSDDGRERWTDSAIQHESLVKGDHWLARSRRIGRSWTAWTRGETRGNAVAAARAALLAREK